MMRIINLVFRPLHLLGIGFTLTVSLGSGWLAHLADRRGADLGKWIQDDKTTAISLHTQVKICRETLACSSWMYVDITINVTFLDSVVQGC